MFANKKPEFDPSKCETCSLATARKGQHFEIVSVDDEHARVQALRFGMAEGACVECITRIPAGPIVLKSGRQEIAVGRSLAERIQVRKRHHGHHHGQQHDHNPGPQGASS